MFEDRTYENILQEMLDMAPEGVDTRQGSIFYDASAPAAFKLAKFYADLSMTFNLVFIDTAEGEYLDKKANERGVYRLPAKACKRQATFTGTTPNVGERFFVDEQFFVLKRNDEIGLFVEAEEAGEKANSIPVGENLVPLNNIYGLSGAVLGQILEPGTLVENDEDLHRRLREKIAGPAENGNKQHYKTWCEEVTGVGRARIFPLWNGANTVKGVLIDTQGLPATQSVVEEVQVYVDPGSQGLGEGVANLGAYFTSVAAQPLIIDIYLKVALRQGATITEVQEQATSTFTTYLRNLALTTPESEAMVIRLSAIGNLIYDLKTVIDYSDLTLNRDTSNIVVGIESCPVLGVVTIEQLP